MTRSVVAVIGLPMIHDHPAEPEAAERVVWEDPRRSGATVHGLLVDRVSSRSR